MVTGRRRLPEAVGRLPKSRAALEYADAQHAGQLRRSDGRPFIEHPLEVGGVLYRAGAPDHVIAAGLLHDVLEKTHVSAAELRAEFGPAIARLVSAVSEDQTIGGYRLRKAALRQQVAAAGNDALLIFAADKISKVRELRRAVAAAHQHDESFGPSLLPPRRLDHLRACLALLERRLGHAPLVKLLESEMAELASDLQELPAVA